MIKLLKIVVIVGANFVLMVERGCVELVGEGLVCLFAAAVVTEFVGLFAWRIIRQ